jgi:hypothetical protein
MGWPLLCVDRGARQRPGNHVGGVYPPSSFDAEETAAIVATVFDEVEPKRWDGKFFPLVSREEVRAYCRHHYIPVERGEQAESPLWLTKRGVLVRATKS